MYIPLLIAGMIALFGGRFVITNSFTLTGDRARIFGGFLVAPWIIAAASGVAIGGANPLFGVAPTVTGNGLTGTIVFWGCVMAALLYGVATRNWNVQDDADAESKPGAKASRPRKAA